MRFTSKGWCWGFSSKAACSSSIIKWFERVPVLIPLSWFTVSWACWILARRVTNGISAVLFATCLLVAWDLLLDPAMSRVTSYWVWGDTGAYYGMPLMNWVGWGVTGFLLLFLIARLAPEPQGDVCFATWVYLVNFALPFGFCVLNRYWLAAVVGPFSIGLACAAFGKVHGRKSFAAQLGLGATGAFSQRGK